MNWLAWWNLIYLLPFGLALLYLALYVTTGMDFGGDADADADHGDATGDHHADVETDADLHGDGIDHDAHEALGDLDHDAAHADLSDGHVGDAHGHHHHHGHGHGHPENGDPKSATPAAFSILSLVGFGKAPLLLVVSALAMLWGVGGLLANQFQLERGAAASSAALLAWSAPIAAGSAVLLSGLFFATVGRFIPRNLPSAGATPASVVGSDAVAVLPIDERFGLARLVDATAQAQIQIACRTAPGEEPIAAHQTVKLMRYDRADKVFYVTTPARLAERGGDPKRAAQQEAIAEKREAVAERKGGR